MSLLPAGAKLGRFQISSVLGQGAMGVVYLAHDPEIGRPVAVKTLRPGMAEGEEAAQLEARFLKEARLAGRLQHPNIVTVYDVGKDGETCFIAMEYVDGRPLTRCLGAAPELTLAAKVGIVRQVAEALAHAHERGVLHRDIKPGNILIARDGRVKVTDFGIGKFTGTTTSDLTRTGQMVGSPAYMSPEQIRGEKLDGRSDLFSLGVVLYELLTGSRPFPGESITTLVYQILHTEPRDPLALRSDLPPATREVMARLLAKRADRRPADAREFLVELARIERLQRESELTRRAVVAAPDTKEETLPARAVPAAAKPPESWRGGRPLLVVLLGALLAGTVLLLRESRTEPPAPRPSPAVPAPAATSIRVAPSAVPSPEPTAPVEPTPDLGAAAEAPATAPAAERGRPAKRREAPAPAPARHPEQVSAPAAGAPPAPAVPSRPDRIDAVYATRRAVRFTSSPEQARLFVDGRYVGIADDWDNRGGGRELEFEKSGTHYVRMELPGYRTLTLQIDVTGESGSDSVSIDEEMDRRERLPYETLPAPADRTTGAVEFDVEPGGAGVSEGGRALGVASSFGPGSPLVLTGTTVHDLLLSAPGYKPRLVRILVAPNAGRDRAKVREKLKAE